MKKILVKSCCGGQQYVYTLDSAIKKSHIESFKESGYIVPQHFYEAGLFYVQKDGVIASSPFGSTKIKVRFSQKAQDQLQKFEELIKSLTTK